MLKLSISLAAALFLAACGGGGDTVSTPTEQPAAVAVAPVLAAPAAPAAPVAKTLTDGLQTPENTLLGAMKCSAGFGPNAGRTVLMIPAATMTVDSELSWTYIPSFDQLGMPWCTVDLPFKHTGDLQIASEYVTYAIRKVHEITKTPMAVIAYSQGGATGRWSLKYFPDTRPMVEDFIGVAAAYHGLIEANLLCTIDALTCVTSFTQISVGSKFIDALNKGGETFAGIDYTSVYTRTDDVAIPNFDEERGISSLRTGDGARANIATQDICLTNIADHFQAITYDPIPFAIALDALQHKGTASLARLKGQGLGLCTKLAAPGVDLVTLPLNFLTKSMFTFATSVALMPKSSVEPKLREYVTY